MAHLKERPTSSADSFTLRLDNAFETWLKRRLPWAYRYTMWWHKWLNRPVKSTPRSVLLSGVATLIIILIVYWLGS